MHELNKFGVVPLFFVLLGTTVLAVLLVWKHKRTADCKLSQEDHGRYLEESIAIQPNNSVIFMDNCIGEVIVKGITMLKADNYDLLEGDIDV